MADGFRRALSNPGCHRWMDVAACARHRLADLTTVRLRCCRRKRCASCGALIDCFMPHARGEWGGGYLMAEEVVVDPGFC